MARVLMISANRERVNMLTWPLGAASVAEALRAAGHEVRLADLAESDDCEAALDRALEGFSPRVIGLSLRNIDNQSMDRPVFYLEEARRLVEMCRRRSGAPIVIGGAGYSIFPGPALRYLGADFGLPGEGEGAFPRLVERLAGDEDPRGDYLLYRKDLPPAGNRSFVDDLDGFPLPDPRGIPAVYRDDGNFMMPVQTRRGCPMKCVYCSTPSIEGAASRSRSPVAVARWMASLRDRGIRRFYFVDNTFNLPGSYAGRLCEELARSCPGIDWRAIVYPAGVDDRLAELMARGGCAEVSLGFESGGLSVLAALGKDFGPDEVRRVSVALGRQGIRRMGFLLLGGPGETADTARRSIDFARSLDLEGGKITVGIRIYPGTPLARRAVAEGVIREDDDLLQPRFYLSPAAAECLGDIVAGSLPDLKGWTA